MADDRSRTDERNKAIDLAFSQIEKQFGKGSIMRLGIEGSDCSHRCDLHGCDFASTPRWA